MSKEILIVRLKGGLGNQLFQYACGYALSLASERKLCLSTDAIVPPRRYQLDIFGIKADPGLDLMMKDESRSHTFAYSGSYQSGLERELEEVVRSCKKPVYVIEGYFQNEYFFRNVVNDIRNLFSIDPLHLWSAIDGTLVGVHVRRGDYVYHPRHEVCTLDYYLRAMDLFRTKFRNAQFVIVSDDISWCRDHLNGGDIYVHDGGSEEEDFRVLLACDAFIIPNSSFSWWPAWISQSSSVIYPSVWLQDKHWDIAPARWTPLAPGNDEAQQMEFKETKIAYCNPFNGDTFLHAETARLIGKWGVEVAMETGTYEGHTTLALSLLCDLVYTVEINPDTYSKAAHYFEQMNEHGEIQAILGSSPDVISSVASEMSGKRVLFYLDAHWEDYWPLLDELRIIADLPPPRPVIVIHDFQVPNRPELGFDTYHGTALNDKYVLDAVEKIFKGECVLHCNRIASGAKRGVLFVEPKQ